MKRVRINGLVRLANRVRQQIAQPISPERLTQLRNSTSRSIEAVNRVLSKNGVRVDALPTPMICFKKETVRLLAEQIFRKSPNKKLNFWKRNAAFINTVRRRMF
jgi:hypothetical protein